MMTNLTPPLPPVTLTDEAMKLAAALLQIAANPQAAEARLAELGTQTQGLRDAIAQHEAASAKAADVATRETAAAAREQNVSAREESLIKAQTQLNVASGALASRDEALNSREATHALREADLAKRVAELDRRVESYRAALAG